jgi:3-phosphoshikimate 1-carboxyvinyltransferase
MALPDLLPIQPFIRPVKGDAVVPGSKSLTNRALLLGALCSEPVTLTGALFSEDTRLMIAALRALGFTVATDEEKNRIEVSRQEAAFPNAERRVDLFVGLAGTAARFLTALCAAAPRGIYRIDGTEQMRKRPMAGLIAALRALGARIDCLEQEGFFPIEVQASGLRGGAVKIDARESSQLLSGLLMVAPLAAHGVEIELIGGVRWPFVQMTARLMEHFGQPPLRRVGEDRIQVAAGIGYRFPAGAYAVEPDASAASYFLALPLVVGGEISLPGLRPAGDGLQGDIAFAEVLRRAGLSVEHNAHGLTARFAPGQPRRGVVEDFRGFSDTFLTLAAIAPLLSGVTKISGIAHTRKQETDRVAGMARELIKLGQTVIEQEDSLEIHPQPLRSEQVIETYGDHRFAMSFGILGSHDLHGNGRPWLTIKNPACCAKTFPRFFELLDALRARSVNA